MVVPAATVSDKSLERLVPDRLDADDATGRDTLALHLERYAFAARFVRAGRVLDCACGVGYGSAILAAAECRPELVLGVDISAEAVRHATEHYRTDTVDYRVADGCRFDDPEGFDTIVSLETIEHTPDPEALVANFARLLRPGGTLIASVPVTPSVDVNPYHLHDFTPGRFRRLGASHGLVEIDALQQVQPFSPFKIATGREHRLDDMRTGLLAYYLRHPKAVYLRAKSTLVDGFRNKYLTIAWTRPASR